MDINTFMTETGFDGNGGRRVGIAIIDDGIKDMKPNISYMYDFFTGHLNDEKSLNHRDSHGEQIYDIINSIAPNANYYIFKAFDDKGFGGSLPVYESLIRCRDIEDIDLICMSFSSFREMNKLTKKVLMECLDEKKLIFAPVGNDKSSQPTYPSAIDGVFKVGGLEDDLKTIYEKSNYIKNLSFVAPSRITVNDRDVSGTSFSNALVVGQIADIMSYGNIKREEFEYDEIIREYCKLKDYKPDLAYGVLYKK